MQQTGIHIVNSTLLVIIILGIPAITSKQIGRFAVTSTPDARMLTIWGLGLAASLNLAGWRWLGRGKKARDLCRNWALVHGGILLLLVLLYEKQIHFNWLKDLLLWFKEKVIR